MFDPAFAQHFFHVDEISPDKVRATVSNTHSIYLNMLILLKLGLVPAPMGKNSINGIFILPIGKYVCLIVHSTNPQRMADGMIFLDLTNRTDAIDDIAQKFGNPELEQKFMETVQYIFNHPETHSRAHLVRGENPPGGDIFIGYARS